MLVIPPGFGKKWETNLTAAARGGATITGGAANTKGSYTSLIDPTTRPSVGIHIAVYGLSAATTVTGFLLDIAYGPTGGGSEEVICPNLNVGAADSTSSVPKVFFFPIPIPAGVRVSARGQGAVASDTCVVAIWLCQDEEYAGIGGKVADYGTNLTNSRGTSVTPASGSYGTWVDLTAGAGTLRNHRFWTVGMDQLADTSIALVTALCELGLGPNSGDVTPIAGPFRQMQHTSEIMFGMHPPLAYAPVKAGSLLWAHLASGEAEARGLIAYGVD